MVRIQRVIMTPRAPTRVRHVPVLVHVHAVLHIVVGRVEAVHLHVHLYGVVPGTVASNLLADR